MLVEARLPTMQLLQQVVYYIGAGKQPGLA